MLGPHFAYKKETMPPYETSKTGFSKEKITIDYPKLTNCSKGIWLLLQIIVLINSSVAHWWEQVVGLTCARKKVRFVTSATQREKRKFC
jgi:hypothetical protein